MLMTARLGPVETAVAVMKRSEVTHVRHVDHSATNDTPLPGKTDFFKGHRQSKSFSKWFSLCAADSDYGKFGTFK